MRHISTKKISSIFNISQRGVIKKASRESWQSVPRKGRGGGHEWLIDSMPEKTREQILLAISKEEALIIAEHLKEPEYVGKKEFFPMSSKQEEKAKAKADLLYHYKEWMLKHGKSIEARNEFIASYHNGLLPSIYNVIGKTSWKSIERWKNQMKRGNLTHLADKRGTNASARVFSPEHEEILTRLALHPNAPCFSQVNRAAQGLFKANGLYPISEATVRRFFNKWVNKNFGTWTYTRHGKKAWNDLCAFAIERDYSLISVGDIAVADGHRLNFEIINPETGKPKRMEVVLWYDMASNFPLGGIFSLLKTHNP